MVWFPPTKLPPKPPDDLTKDELLARSVFSTKHFKKSKSVGYADKVFPKAFEPPKDKDHAGQFLDEVSVDRCRYLQENRALQLGEQKAAERNLTFYGWAIIEKSTVARKGCDAIASPVNDNPAHANIKLPIDDITDQKDLRAYLGELADNCCWLDAPSYC